MPTPDWSRSRVLRPTISNELIQTFGADNASAHLCCFRANSSQPTFSAFDTKIIAIKVGTITGP